jgi:hypothetical protein
MSLLGIPIIESDLIREDCIYLIGPKGSYAIRGTRPLTEVERAGVEARQIVREVLADVLAWLDQ